MLNFRGFFKVSHRQSKRWFGLGIVFLAAALGIQGVQAATCTLETVSGDASESGNKYLYLTADNYGARRAYACDKSHCGGYVVSAANTPHYVGDTRKDEIGIYECDAQNPNAWAPARIPECETGKCAVNMAPKLAGNSQLMSRRRGTHITSTNTAYESDDLCTCTRARIKQDRITRQRDRAYKWFADSIQNSCVASGGKYTAPNADWIQVSLPYARDMDQDEWSIPDNFKWESVCACSPGTVLFVDLSHPMQCIKVVGKNKDKNGAPGAGDKSLSAVKTELPDTKAAPTTKEECEKADGYQWINDKCLTTKDYEAAVAEERAQAEQAKKAAEKAAQEEARRSSIAKINAAVTALNAIEAKFTTSKWRDEEGKFNTARLASDLTAGVVLGTTGGVVTSVLMRKGQAKQGFEKLRCRIGGQTVASWGDEFTVGSSSAGHMQN